MRKTERAPQTEGTGGVDTDIGESGICGVPYQWSRVYRYVRRLEASVDEK